MCANSADPDPECRSFAPVADDRTAVLVLGSMPGRESLRRREYYGFPRNQFWSIAGECFGFDPSLPYRVRLDTLLAHGIGLWDVLAACERPASSLDAAILAPVPNDIPGILARFPRIRRICCNGTAAANYLAKFFPEIDTEIRHLPSTSPAAAMFSREEKLRVWREALTTPLPPRKTCRFRRGTASKRDR